MKLCGPDFAAMTNRTADGRSSYTVIPTSTNNGVPTQSELATTNILTGTVMNRAGSLPDGFDYESGPDRKEATVRFGNFTAIVTRRHGLVSPATGSEFKPGYLAESYHQGVDKKARRLKVELRSSSCARRNDHAERKDGEIVTMVGGYDFYTSKFNNAVQAYRQTAQPLSRSFIQRQLNGG